MYFSVVKINELRFTMIDSGVALSSNIAKTCFPAHNYDFLHRFDSSNVLTYDEFLEKSRIKKRKVPKLLRDINVLGLNQLQSNPIALSLKRNELAFLIAF